MRTLFLFAAALPLLLPLGGTVLELPVEGRADAARIAAARAQVQLETWDCGKHPLKDPGNMQLLTCKTCGQPLAKTTPDPKAERFFKVELSEQRLRVVSGPGPGLGLLRQSTVEKALKDAGLTLRAGGWRLYGHVLLEVEAQDKATSADLDKALAPFGTVERDAKGGLVLLRLAEARGGQDHAALLAAVKSARHTLKDTLWILNQCAGELVTVR